VSFLARLVTLAAASDRPATNEVTNASPVEGERRSRRGGRGRRGGGAGSTRREGVGHDTKSAGMKPHDSGAASTNAPRSNGNARGRDADKGSRPTTPAATPAPAATHKKQGFFHRLTRLFKR